MRSHFRESSRRSKLTQTLAIRCRRLISRASTKLEPITLRSRARAVAGTLQSAMASTQHTYYLAMRGFYGQRCGTAVDMGPEFPGYSHPACHLHGEFHPSSGATGPRDNIGGWHDAGDYGRYMVNSGISTGTLLWTWEIYGAETQEYSLSRFPRSGNGTPDILNEARWNLEWMLEDAGRRRRRLAQADQRTLSRLHRSRRRQAAQRGDRNRLGALQEHVRDRGPGGCCARLQRACIQALSMRSLPRGALEAARRAWAWTEKNPNVTFRNPPGISTGEYGDSNCEDRAALGAGGTVIAPPAKRRTTTTS